MGILSVCISVSRRLMAGDCVHFYAVEQATICFVSLLLLLFFYLLLSPFECAFAQFRCAYRWTSKAYTYFLYSFVLPRGFLGSVRASYVCPQCFLGVWWGGVGGGVGQGDPYLLRYSGGVGTYR